MKDRSRLLLILVVQMIIPLRFNFSEMPTGIELLDPSMQAGSIVSDNKFQCEQAAMDVMAVDSNTPNIFANNKVGSNMAFGLRTDGIGLLDVQMLK